jgi:hypothetical protein
MAACGRSFCLEDLRIVRALHFDVCFLLHPLWASFYCSSPGWPIFPTPKELSIGTHVHMYELPESTLKLKAFIATTIHETPEVHLKKRTNENREHLLKLASGE